METAARVDRHTTVEDALAIATACAFVSLGLALLASARLLLGGTVGIALLLARVTHVRFGPIYFVLNLPFFWLGVRQLGARFTLKTFAAIGLLAFLTDALPLILHLDRVHPVYAALMGGSLAGVGLLILFRHQASLGGLNILALYLQGRFGARAGVVLLAIDAAILLASLFIVSLQTIALSILGAAALNLVLAVNHRPGRYVAT
jgi:uncharacterized membrane-anchored protein YitT (DUF2179 family)